MSLWRLEWLRLIRTRRLVALAGVYLFFGFLGPLSARYLSEIVSFAGGELEGATIEFPPPTPADGMLQYSSNAMQVGTLVAVVVAAGALAFDAVPEMGVFLRTRVPVLRRLLVPRIVVTFVAVGVAFVLGGLAAWYETWALIGAPDASGVAAGIGLGVLYLGFVVALVTAVAGRTRTVLGTVMTAIVVLLVLPLVGLARAIGRWLPSTLAAALGPLAGGADPADYLPAALVTAGLIVVLVLLGVALARRKEL